jgi:hypothetical protein
MIQKITLAILVCGLPLIVKASQDLNSECKKNVDTYLAEEAALNPGENFKVLSKKIITCPNLHRRTITGFEAEGCFVIVNATSEVNRSAAQVTATTVAHKFAASVFLTGSDNDGRSGRLIQSVNVFANPLGYGAKSTYTNKDCGGYAACASEKLDTAAMTYQQSSGTAKEVSADAGFVYPCSEIQE